MCDSSGVEASTRDSLVFGWNPGEPDSSERRSSLESADRTTSRNHEVLNFALPVSLRSLPQVKRADSGATLLATGREYSLANDPDRSTVEFPRTGNVISGFLLRAELGQGAFARVYRAEQCALANRQVALKVSEALGDEPQALARLQHAHIVPIHSVHDDPQTGFRLLCMPYLGGANLAQLLDQARQGHDRHEGGRSLVDALDRIEHSKPAEQCTLLRMHQSRSFSIPAIEEAARPTNPLIHDATPHTHVRSAIARYLQRLSRSRRTPDDEPGVGPHRVENRDQPARRFYRHNSFVRTAAWIIARLAEALEHAHTRGILHRDLKPSNVLIAADGTPMLLDFNLSETQQKLANDATRARVGGTLPYMSPEHLDAFSPSGNTKASEVDERSDLYSLGLIFYEMLAGRHPFNEPDANLPLADAIERLIEERRKGPPPLRRFNPAVPPSLEAIVNRCLTFDRATRCPSAAELAEDLRRFLDNLPNKHAPEPSLRERAAKWLRRHPRFQSAGTVAALALALIVSLGVGAWTIADRLMTASALLAHERFSSNFQQAQLLLNTSSGPESHLPQGLKIADAALRAYELDGYQLPRAGWERQPRIARLPHDQRVALLQDLSELLIMRARARVHQSMSLGVDAQRQAVEAGLASLRVAERIDPNPPSALFLDRAHFEAMLGLTKQSDADRRRAERTPFRGARDYYLQGTALAAAGHNDEAARLLGQAVVLDGRQFWAWFVLGLCHYDLGQYAEAASDFANCTLLSPRFAWPYLNRGLALSASGRLEEALTCYEKALQLSPDFREARVNRALVCLRLGQYERSRVDLQWALHNGLEQPEYLAAYAETLDALGDDEGAQRVLTSALESQPNRPELRLARGLFRLKNGQREAAETDLRAALNQAPKSPRAHLALAHLLRGRDPAQAIEHLDAALRADPTCVEAVELRALLRARMGDPRFESDVDLLATKPTPTHLYNAACALSVYAAKSNDSSKLHRAAQFLVRSFSAGFPLEEALSDPDLTPLRDAPDFHGLFESVRTTGMPVP